MTLGSDLAAALPGLRMQAESRFSETFKVFYIEKSAEPDAETGLYTETEVAVYESMAGRIKFPSLTVAEREQGSQVPAIQDVQIHVAVGSAVNVEVDHVWRCTASSSDASLVGCEFRTKGLPAAGQVSASRFPVESVS